MQMNRFMLELLEEKIPVGGFTTFSLGRMGFTSAARGHWV
jgi:hypothetical protein